MSDLLKQIRERNLIAITDEKVDNWEDAIGLAVAPLIKRGDVKPEYVDDIIANVKQYGPYICIVPNICIPHAMSHDNVSVSNISFVKFNNPVNFEDDNNKGDQFISSLFFAIAAKDPDEHLANLSLLMEALDDPTLIDRLCSAKTITELNAIIDEQ